ncbi:MAG: phosphoribosylformylglycinamidine cyclo-ligase [bacterium]
MKPAKSAYAQAGVNIDAKMNALSAAKRMIRQTMTPSVVGEWGSFGGLFKAPGRDMLLVSSIDGVGTKLKVAERVGRHDTVGQDIVNHCVNDILVQGAFPLFFLDYVGTSKVEHHVFQQLIEGMCIACRQNGCALIGGETAELPDLYPEGEYDLVGTIVGAVRKKGLITGKDIRAGDVMIGLPSSGLHTNGYSLARAVIFRKAQLEVDDPFPGTKRTVGDVLLAVHKSYLKPIQSLIKAVKVRGLAHITGGGFEDNIPRVLPRNVTAVVDRASWTPPAVFQFIRDVGQVTDEEMYRVFNMGIGMVIVVREADVKKAMQVLRKAGEKPAVIGHIEKGHGEARLV